MNALPRSGRSRLFALLAVWAAAAAVAGCTPSIGDACAFATECSARGDRLCDTTQPGGYCTIANCTRGSCPEDSFCVLFGATEPGCPTNDRATPRFGRTYCMASCASSSDCRGGYVCASPTGQPWAGSILDDAARATVCLAAPSSPVPDAGASAAPVSAVCAPTTPPVSGSVDAARP